MLFATPYLEVYVMKDAVGTMWYWEGVKMDLFFCDHMITKDLSRNFKLQRA